MRIDYLSVTARYWDAEAQRYCASHPEHLDRALHPSWGLWHVPESTIGLLAGSIFPGTQVVDLGCGRGHDAVGFADLGATVLAVDISREQLNHSIHHPRVKYVLADAASLPLLADAVDVVLSDHGAFDHAPAAHILPEVHRVLKPGGLLAVCTYSPIAVACYDPRTRRIGEQLVNPYPSGQMRFDGTLVGSEMSYADWVRTFIECGFEIARLVELHPSADSKAYFDELVDLNWATRWPTDIAWVVKKRS